MDGVWELEKSQKLNCLGLLPLARSSMVLVDEPDQHRFGTPLRSTNEVSVSSPRLASSGPHSRARPGSRWQFHQKTCIKRQNYLQSGNRPQSGAPPVTDHNDDQYPRTSELRHGFTEATQLQVCLPNVRGRTGPDLGERGFSSTTLPPPPHQN